MQVAHPPPTAGVPCHILVVEDNPDGRESLRLLLSLLGHHVEVAADGAEGLRRVLEMRPKVAIVDIGLPKLNGYEVARGARAALGHNIVLVAHTAYDQEEIREQMAEAGFDGHLVKPADLEDFTLWLERAPADHGG